MIWVGNFLRKNAVYVAMAVLIIVVLLLVRCTGQQGALIGEQKRTIQTEQKLGKANEGAADKRLSDQATLQNQQQEIEDAVENATSPDDARARRGCVVLRQQHRDTSGIAACRGR